MFVAEFETVESSVRRRRAPRAPVALEASLNGSRFDRALCTVVDLSTTGARLSTYSMLRRGSEISLVLPDLGAVPATVVWSTDFEAGCEFRRPLRQDLVDKLRER
ncbi:hypothetical protein GCM10011380_21770 [Sphingomonas metalli]|jgi:hypothetical protein|uniref:PilZ domain-containing protein n=1 Tax=Sphingomonas metalli TaxID=1779358 RepID=A0A916T4W9_9SPHN|nr:PilZ domain-containing protein [Sphingomonas metalli]GGB31994.1 hypothetical protein GCM10011380_21770 [Sphingomonas metalli]